MIRRRLVAAAVAGLVLAAAPSTAHARHVVASCYGPGLIGNRTADGTVLTSRTLGIAHRTWPLGTRVHLRSGSTDVYVRVIDRGPFHKDRHGRYDRDVDVTIATARRLGYLPTIHHGACTTFGVRPIHIWRTR